MNLSSNSKITKTDGAQATAAADFNGSSVDMQGFEGVVFLVSLGSAAANNGVKAQGSSDDGSADAFADLAGTEVLSDGTQTELVLDIYRPLERFVRPVVIRGTTTTIEAIWAIQYGPRKVAVTNVTASQAAEVHASPGEGTA